MTISPESWWGSVTAAEFDALTTPQRHAVSLAAHGVGQREAARLIGVSRTAYTDRLRHAEQRILAYRSEAA